mgnify:CR=1 FL=1|tara:strand:+ start:994 stop:1125 length:132 start_codon:yes stop_codon:yes gene_type:complete
MNRRQRIENIHIRDNEPRWYPYAIFAMILIVVIGDGVLSALGL